MKSNLLIEPKEEHYSDRATYLDALVIYQVGMKTINEAMRRDATIEANAEGRRDRDNRERSDEETMGDRE